MLVDELRKVIVSFFIFKLKYWGIDVFFKKLEKK